MTNQEWLGTLSPEEWWDAVYEYLLHDYASHYNHTQIAVIEWLKKEHEPIKMWDDAQRKLVVRWGKGEAE